MKKLIICSGTILLLAAIGLITSADTEVSAHPIAAVPQVEKPLDQAAAEALVAELKEGLADLIDDEDAVAAITAKWQAHNLVGKTRTQILNLLFADVKSVVEDKDTLDSIWEDWKEAGLSEETADTPAPVAAPKAAPQPPSPASPPAPQNPPAPTSITNPYAVGQLFGQVFLQQADGQKVPLADANIDVYHTDPRPGQFHIKTDKRGKFIFAGLPYDGIYIVAASYPSAAPKWISGVKAGREINYEITLTPGDGKRLTLEEIKAAGGANTPPPR